MNPILILSTAPDEKTAKSIANELVDASLAACVNIIPGIRSIYKWQGETIEDSEYILFIKSILENEGKIFERVKAIHPYEVPELIRLSVDGGEETYLNWLTESAIHVEK